MRSLSAEYRGTLAWFARNPVAANLLMTLILGFGLITAMGIRTEAFPPFPPNSLNVVVSVPGSSPEEIEESVAVKIEEALNGVIGIKQIVTSIGESSVNVQISSLDGFSLTKLKDDVKERVDNISTFPLQAEKPLITEETDERHVLSVEVSGDVSDYTLEKVAKRVRDELVSIPEVSRVGIAGLTEKEISIEISKLRLQEYGLTIEQVAQAIQGASINQSGGNIKTDHGNITLRMQQQAYQAIDFRGVVVRQGENGSVVYLSDVGVVREMPIEKELFNRFNGKSSLSIAVALQGSDSITVTADAVRAQLEGLADKSWLPESVQLTVWNDASQMIRERLYLMGKNALSGIFMVVLMLALFLNFRVALWVAIGIPVSFAGTFIVMGPQFLNYSLNELTTFGFIIVLGVVVDDAIVIGEAVYSEKESSNGNDDPIETTIRGASHVAVPATFGVLTTVAAFLPLLFIQSEMGELFGSIAVVVIVTLLFSLIESKWILPAHLVNLEINSPGSRFSSSTPVRYWTQVQSKVDGVMFAFVDRAYKPVFQWAIAHQYTSLCLFLALFVVIVGLVPAGQVRSVFFPDIESPNVQAKLIMKTGRGSDQLSEASKAIENAVLKIREELQLAYPDDKKAIRHSYSVSESERKARFIIELAPDSERSFSTREVITRWRNNIGKIDGVKSLDIYAKEAEEFSDIQIHVSAPDSKDLEFITEAVKKKLRNYKGLSNIKTSYDEGDLQLDIQLKPEAYRLGLNETQVAQQIRNVLYGYEVQRIQRGREELKVWVRYPKGDRDQLSDLNEVRIKTIAGLDVPLSAVATLARSESTTNIERINKHRTASVTAQSDKESVSSANILDHLSTNFFPALQIKYPGLYIEMDGDAAEEKAAQGSLLTGFLLGLCLIYALLAIPLKSYIEPLVIMAVIPFGVIGAIIGHIIVGIPLSILSFFGLLALSGVVVNDALVLTSRYKDYKHEKLSDKEAIWAAANSRFRPIFLTSITTFVGLAPLLLETSEQAQILIPMAVSLGFGIMFATVINLLIIPILLCISQDVRALYKRKVSYL